MSMMHFDYSNMRQVFLQAIIIVCFGIAVGLMFNYPLLMHSLESDVTIAAPDSVGSKSGGSDKGQP